MASQSTESDKQLLHIVIGGELEDLEGTTFRNLDEVEVVGLYPNYAKAYDAWKSAAQRTVDNAHMRYFIVHLHRLLDPSTGHHPLLVRRRRRRRYRRACCPISKCARDVGRTSL